MKKSDGTSRLEDWLDRYGEALRRAVRRVVPRRLGTAAMDEIEQEVRIRLWKTLEGERKIHHPTSYLHRMTLNATIDALRQTARRPAASLETLLEEGREGGATPEPASGDPSPEERARRRQVLESVEQCLAELPVDRARAVRCYLQGFTTRETGVLFGWTEPRARNLTYRGLTQLRRRLTLLGIDHGLEDLPR
jgi:RNA polymerase sigma-70 factor (ECF subfamily)